MPPVGVGWHGSGACWAPQANYVVKNVVKQLVGYVGKNVVSKLVNEFIDSFDVERFLDERSTLLRSSGTLRPSQHQPGAGRRKNQARTTNSTARRSTISTSS